MEMEAPMKKFFVKWTKGTEAGLFTCEAKTSSRAVSLCLAELRSTAVVTSEDDVFQVDFVVEERL